MSNQNQLPVQTLTEQEWNQLIGYINGNSNPVASKCASTETKVGAIPKNFFFCV